MTQKPDGGPAFPRSGVKDGYGRIIGDVKGISLRQYAAIELRVPNSGTDWLNDMIRQAKRDYFAGLASDKDIEKHMNWAIHKDFKVRPEYTREQAKYRYADAMIAARDA